MREPGARQKAPGEERVGVWGSIKPGNCASPQQGGTPASPLLCILWRQMQQPKGLRLRRASCIWHGGSGAAAGSAVP